MLALSCIPTSSTSVYEDSASRINFAELTLEEIVKTPKYLTLLKELKRHPKTELHAHLGGAIPVQFIQNHSTPEAYADLTNFVEKMKKGVDYTNAFQAFSMIGKVLNTNNRIEDAAYAFCRGQYEDHVTFTELRTGLKKLDGSFEDYLKAVIAGLKRGMQDYPIKVTLVLSLRRDTLLEDANQTVDLAIKYRGEILTGLDISGESTKGDGREIVDSLKQARAAGLPITLHIGESSKEIPAQQLKELTEFEPLRVGHAVHLCPEAKAIIEKSKIVIEACIRSALSVSMITKPGEHPALTLFKKGHPVVFCTDDSTLFGNLSEELALVACLCNLSLEKVIALQKQALEHAFKS